MVNKKEVIKRMLVNNDPDYQLIKALEELSELQTALLQFITKKGRKTTKQDVIEEIGDVKIRMKILEKVFGKKAVNKRVTEKLTKFDGYMNEKKFSGQI